MKNKLFLAVIFTALVTVVSCGKDDKTNNLKDVELKNIVLQVEQETTTKGIGNPEAAATVAFTNGFVVFVDDAKVATDVFKIVAGTPGDGEVNMTNTINFEEVSGQSRNVYILGNVPSSLSITVGTNMATLLATSLEAKTQTNSVTASSVAAVTLFGETKTAIDHTKNPSEATLKVAPVSSRIEIAKFTGKGEVTSYQIDAIFMNNFYNKATYAGNLTSSQDKDKIYNGKENTPQNPLYFKTDGISQYAAADMGYFFNEDLVSGLAAPGLVATPANGVWAYNLFAPVNGEFPHIVIRVSKIQGVTEIPANEIRWMTVTKFVEDKTGGVDITTFEPGKIYKIANFEFDETNLDVSPEMKTVKAKVNVTLAQWEPVPVKPW